MDCETALACLKYPDFIIHPSAVVLSQNRYDYDIVVTVRKQFVFIDGGRVVKTLLITYSERIHQSIQGG